MIPDLMYSKDVKPSSEQDGRELHLHYSYMVLTTQLLVSLQNLHDHLLFFVCELWQIRDRTR
jgi:hypothetical protein